MTHRLILNARFITQADAVDAMYLILVGSQLAATAAVAVLHTWRSGAEGPRKLAARARRVILSRPRAGVRCRGRGGDGAPTHGAVRAAPLPGRSGGGGGGRRGCCCVRPRCEASVGRPRPRPPRLRPVPALGVPGLGACACACARARARGQPRAPAPRRHHLQSHLRLLQTSHSSVAPAVRSAARSGGARRTPSTQRGVMSYRHPLLPRVPKPARQGPRPRHRT